MRPARRAVLLVLLGVGALLPSGILRAEEEEIPVVPRDLGQARKQIERFVSATRELKKEQEERKRIEAETEGTIGRLGKELEAEASRDAAQRDRGKIRELRGRILEEYRKRLEQFAGPETDALVKLALQRDGVVSAVGYMSAYLGKLIEGYGEPGAARRIALRLEERQARSREELQSEFATLAAKGLYDPVSRNFSDEIPEETVRRIEALRSQVLQDQRVLALLQSTETPERFVAQFQRIRLVLETAKGKIRDLYERLEDRRTLVLSKLNGAIEYLRVIETVEDMEDFVRGMTEAVRSLEEVSGAIDGLVDSLDIYVARGLDSVIDIPEVPGAGGGSLEVDRTHTLLRALELLEGGRRENR